MHKRTAKVCHSLVLFHSMNQGTGTMDYYLDFPELNLQNFRLAKTAMLGMLMEVGKPVKGAH